MSKNINTSIENINIMVVVDAESIITENSNPSLDSNNPTMINHNNQFMICSNSEGLTISNQGTGNLSFSGLTGDLVSFRGVTASGNSVNSIIIYDIQNMNPGNGVFNAFTENIITRSKAVIPNPNSPSKNGLPAINSPEEFYSYSSQISQMGSENFIVKFALYTLDSSHENQVLYGYFGWDPQINVNTSYKRINVLEKV
jgi:hypothetical protein